MSRHHVFDFRSRDWQRHRPSLGKGIRHLSPAQGAMPNALQVAETASRVAGETVTEPGSGLTGLPRLPRRRRDPCEWAPSLSWRSHREATPGGRSRRGGCELDNRRRGRRLPGHVPAGRVSHFDLRALRVWPGARPPGLPRQRPTLSPDQRRRRRRLDLRTVQLGNGLAHTCEQCRARPRRAGSILHLQEACFQALGPLPARMTHESATVAPKKLGFSAAPFHDHDHHWTVSRLLARRAWSLASNPAGVATTMITRRAMPALLPPARP